MSGMKKCHFDAAVNRFKKNMARFAKLSHDATERFSNLGTKNNIDDELSAIRQNIENLLFSETAKEFAPDECRQLSVEIKKMTQNVEAIGKQFILVEEAKEAAKAERDKIDKDIDNMEATLAQLIQEAQHQIDTTDYIDLALDPEVKAVNKLSNDLHNRIRVTGAQITAAYDHQVAAQGNLAALKETVGQLSQRHGHIESLAAKRSETYKIQEARKKAAAQSSEEIAIYLENIENEDFERFMPKAFEELRPAVQTFKTDFKHEDYMHCSKTGPQLVEKLKTFFEELSLLIQAFHEAEQKARTQLKAAQTELAKLNLEEISRWSQKKDEVQKVVTQLEECARQVDEISKTGNRAIEFDTPLRQMTLAITALRKLVDEATNNHARYDARDGVRKAIRNALKELNYDTPQYYFQKKLADGTPDELSGLTIYAHNPAETGNLRMTLDLDGDASLEVYREDKNGHEMEVTQQDAVACHNAVLEFGRRLEADDIHMNITDWGQAKDLPKAQEQGRITWNDANPDDSGNSRLLGHAHAMDKQNTMEKQKEYGRQ